MMSPSRVQPQPPFRVGMGYDIHRFAPGRRLVLGGVVIPDAQGLDGHSDADVVLHALADAVFGALALPDIGHYFPPGEERWRDMDSADIVRKAVAEAELRGWRVGNADLAIIAEKPKLAPYVAAMRARMEALLGSAPGSVGVKATTQEKLGDLGKGLGIAVHAVVLLYAIPSTSAQAD